MIKSALITVSLITLTSCEKPKAESKTLESEKPKVSSGRDSHGCITSAGQTWSEMQQDCIQIFNTGFRLNPIQPEKGKSVISAFILLSDDQSKLELFLPESNDSHILTKSKKNTYINEGYRYDSHSSTLYINGVEKYRGNIE